MDLTYLDFNNLEIGQQLDEWERSYIHHNLLNRIEKRISKLSKVHEPIEENLEETIELTKVDTDFKIIKDMLKNKDLDKNDLVNVFNNKE